MKLFCVLEKTVCDLGGEGAEGFGERLLSYIV